MTSYFFILQLVMVGIIGLFVGGFLNSVIYRLPIVLQRNWRVQCRDFLELPKEQIEQFGFTKPASHCPQCKHHLTVWQILPLLSYIWLRGKCFYCNYHISWRYPIVELLTAVLAVTTFYYFPTSEAIMVVMFNWCLLILMILDIEHKLLVDVITIPLIWLGLFANTLNVFTDSKSAILGAIAGYSVPWFISHVYRRMRSMEGVGYGDFKLLAAIGAWLGFKWLVLIMLTSYLLSFTIACFSVIVKRKGWYESFSFGPYITVTSWMMVFWGGGIMHYLAFLAGRYNITLLSMLTS